MFRPDMAENMLTGKLSLNTNTTCMNERNASMSMISLVDGSPIKCVRSYTVLKLLNWGVKQQNH